MKYNSRGVLHKNEADFRPENYSQFVENNGPQDATICQLFRNLNKCKFDLTVAQRPALSKKRGSKQSHLFYCLKKIFSKHVVKTTYSLNTCSELLCLPLISSKTSLFMV